MPRMPDTPIFQLRIVLRDSRPPIWRRVLVPADMTLGQLHGVIQVAFGWMDCHLHSFRHTDKRRKLDRDGAVELARGEDWDALALALHGERRFGPMRDPYGEPMTDLFGDDPGYADEDGVTLAELFPDTKPKLVYTYDFGDDWEHQITLQKVLEPKPGQVYPVCVAGKRAGPPEDCGGVWGYEHLLAVLADPEHEEHEDLAEWVPEDFDPEAVDLEEINAGLADLRD